MQNFHKYIPYAQVPLQKRTWPDRRIEQAPIWCAVDLRDGNQALINPMNHARKIKMYNLLVEMGFKEIEIGFPSSSQIEFDFARYLIDNDLIPKDVAIQVLMQARPHLIERTFEAVKGARRVIMHIYNSTSVAQRRDVFKMGPDGIAKLACDGVKMIKDMAKARPETEWTLEYSPESFTGTELDVAADICNEVIAAWGPTPQNKMIINLPSTVEMSTPNIYADQIEWMSTHLNQRDSVILSVHTHNDRGCGIASTELALMAGAERVEGTLLGNGERTGNADLITLALNLFTQGVNPELELGNIPNIVKTVEECNQIETHPRHPYVGELVFTALSGSHQDAIKKGLDAHKEQHRNHWDVPYLPLDPSDIGRTYETAIRINSQSGKSGIAYILEKEYGLKLPKAMQIEFAKVIQKIADTAAREILAKEIWDAFEQEYIVQNVGLKLEHWQYRNTGFNENVICDVQLKNDGVPAGPVNFMAEGNGPINAFTEGLQNKTGVSFKLENYEEHTLATGSGAKAAAYISLMDSKDREFYGVGIDSNIITASVKAVLSAFNRMKNAA